MKQQAKLTMLFKNAPILKKGDPLVTLKVSAAVKSNLKIIKEREAMKKAEQAVNKRPVGRSVLRMV